MTYERRFLPRGQFAHLVPYTSAVADAALCGLTVADPRYDWHGTGSQHERERADAMPLCSRCRIAARILFIAIPEPPPAPVEAPSADPADRTLTGSPDRLLTTAAVGALLGINAGSVARWAKERGLGPADRIQMGRSPVTHWSERAIIEASLSKPARKRRRVT